MMDNNKHKTHSIGELIAQFIQGTEAEVVLMERKIIQLWPKVMGSAVANLTGQIEMKNGVLYVHIHSAALRAQLFEYRFDVVRKLNEAINAQFVKDIRLLG